MVEVLTLVAVVRIASYRDTLLLQALYRYILYTNVGSR